MAPEARIKVFLKTSATALCAGVVVLSSFSLGAEAARRHYRSHHHHLPQLPATPPRALPYPQLPLPFEISGAQYLPLAWADVKGWSDDDHLAAYKTFRASCRSINAQTVAPEPKSEYKALGASLSEPCRAAKSLELSDDAKAKTFFEENFAPLRISRLGEPDGFVTGYYEPVLEGSRTQTDVYNVPVYRRPSNLFVRGYKQDSVSLPNKGPVYRKIGRRKLVPYYDRGEIEDGKIAGRGLEIAWLKDPTDLLFAQIQGSARIKFDDGTTLRLNYDAYNGYPYTAVGRILIERGIIPKEEMSMQKIREWMAQNPDGAKELRRQNRAYIFFREVNLSDKDEAVGAQGIPLTAGRSIAVDKSLHVYGTPFFIEGELPIDSERSKTPFHRLMIAQDTGSAIIGPARADLYFGAGADAGRVSGRLRHPMHFVMLVPKSLDPTPRAARLPVPDPRPSEKIAKLFPQTEPAKDQAKPAAPAAAVAPGKGETVAVASPVPLPVPRPVIEPVQELRRPAKNRPHRQQ
ncbi:MULTISPECIES: murein transglycosylase A [Bradyrhizobium]|uniref:peptidoglycan lytic exotransglycosylase n=1 Tax=Bradyrhizobium diazoefficiens TaxID=1355477 RepID=A0A0E4FT87_9BRAD|nr:MULTISPECIES: MltA domain-containing protein [Bradyrhizobium]MBP1060665.1 membrane-bound lytic murein transglycosylase A [Bradyrhizobium japonicum]AND86386.1 lytic transglycosylase [Bradyrhizobium diazoefficiens USDA 110]AWO94979.2 murein transglycosylase A [Bradyrhizobium diazoefficiens]MBR0860749.1 murein transglycosylase A [Bradyrhizobium diazoefficiens]MBR0885240.1 murein transglycosylase A [Bradyrhizobium diazoefficiens]